MHVYDQRIAKTVNSTDTDHFVYNGADVLLVYDGTGSLETTYLHGPATDQVLAAEDVPAGETYWYFADHLGTIRDVATYDDGTDTATVVNHLVYDSFGQIVDQTAGTPHEPVYAFTGREWDAHAGLYYYRARWYAPNLGRFISEDPIGFNGDPTNQYRYVGNTATGFRDPSGLDKDALWNALGANEADVYRPKNKRQPLGNGHTYEDQLLRDLGGYERGIGNEGHFHWEGPDGRRASVTFERGNLESRAIAREIILKIAQGATADVIGQIIKNGIDDGAQLGIRASCDIIDNMLSAKEFVSDPSLATAVGILPVIPGGIRKADELVDGIRTSGNISSAPSGFKLGKHGDFPSPRPSGTQSHHGAMSAWMKKHYPGYDPDKAPAILMPTPNHQRTFGVYNTWRAEMKRRMGGTFDWGKVTEADMRALSEKMFDAAEVPSQMRADYWEWFGRMKNALSN